MSYEFESECPSCGGILGMSIEKMHAKHLGPYKAGCTIGHKGVPWNTVNDMWDEKEPPEEEGPKEPSSNHPASKQQFGQVINVDFKNKKRK